MISREETVVFVWRCSECPAVYDVEGMSFLFTDGAQGICSCGGRLVEDVEPASAHRYRIDIPEALRGSALHRKLERYEEAGGVRVAVGNRPGTSTGICLSEV